MCSAFRTVETFVVKKRVEVKVLVKKVRVRRYAIIHLCVKGYKHDIALIVFVRMSKQNDEDSNTEIWSIDIRFL